MEKEYNPKYKKRSWLRMSLGNEQNMDKVREAMKQAREQEKLNGVAAEVSVGNQAKSNVSIDFVSEFGTHYKGTIEFKRPSVMERMVIGARKSEILRNAGVVDTMLVDNDMLFMAQVIATLKSVITKKPAWLMDIDSIEDIDVLYNVYGEYLKWVDSFRSKPSEDTADQGSETSTTG